MVCHLDIDMAYLFWWSW